MKANNLLGDYCQNCASLLDDAQRNHRNIVILDSQCAAVFNQSGDSSRFFSPEHFAPAIPAAAHKQETAQIQETVKTKAPAKPAPKKAGKRK